MTLIDREVVGLSINLPRAGIDDFHPRIVPPAGFEDGELRGAVDVEIGARILHRVEVAGLAGEVEDEVLALHEILQAVLVAHVGDVHAHAAGEAVDVEKIAAVFRDEAVHEQHVGAEVHELPREIRADEAEAAGDEDAFAAEVLSVGRHVRGERSSAGAQDRSHKTSGSTKAGSDRQS